MRLVILTILALPLLAVLPERSSAHSDASSFAGGDHDHGHAHDHAEAGATRYPATVITDPQKVVNVVLKVNARVTRVLAGFVGEKVSRGQVLAEFESAELATLQQTFIETVANREAMVAFSTTGEEKLLEGRMNLRWRGLSDSEIQRVENERKPVAAVAIVSPVDGTIYGLDASISRIVSAGSRGGLFSTAGTTVFRIARHDALLIEAQVPSAKRATLKPGAAVKLSVPGVQETKLSGTVETAVTLANPANRSVTVRIRPDRESAAVLISGQRLELTLDDDAKDHHHHGHHHD